MRAWFYRETSYKKLLSRLIEESQSSRGIISRIAQAVGCQRSYLSQVLHSKVHLTKEQAWSVCVFFGLGEEETRYFEILVDHDRAASPAYRKHLQGQLASIRRDAGKIAKQFESTSFSDADALEHFSSWLPTAVHMLTSVPDLQEPARIAERLQVRLTTVLATLTALEKKGLVKQQKNRWVFAKGTGYFPRESSYVSFHHQNWRALAVDDSRAPHTDGLHYTMVQTLSQKDFETLKALILEFIAQTKKVAEPSPPEILTALNIDFFQPR